MAGYYFLTLAALVVAGFFLGRYRAASLAVGANGGPMLHSLPTYHGLFTAALIFVPMLLTFMIGAPVLGRLANSAALSFFPPEVAADELQARVRAARCGQPGRRPVLGHALA